MVDATVLSTPVEVAVNVTPVNVSINETPVAVSVVQTPVLVDPQEAPVEVFILEGAPGPMGPQGPVGPPATPGADYIHYQGVAATVWTINHNLGFRPQVEVLDSAKTLVLCQVVHPSINQTICTFGFAMAGEAYLD